MKSKIYLRTHNKQKKRSNLFLYIFLGLFIISLLIFIISRNIKNKPVESATVQGNTSQATQPDECEKFSKYTNYIPNFYSKKWYLTNYSTGENKNVYLYLPKELSQANPEVILYIDETKAAGNFQKIINVTSSTTEEIEDQKTTYYFEVTKFLPGEHKLKVRIKHKCFNLSTATNTITVSYPVIVTWTQDWEGYDVKDEYIKDLETISREYGVPMTHFWNPRIYVKGAISTAKKEKFNSWVKNRHEVLGEEIGLHLHMFYDMQKEIGVQDIGQRWNQPKIVDGYDVLLSQFSKEDVIKIIEWSKDKFEENDLPTPKIFRAGGWFAGPNTLAALDELGFSIDSSGRTSYKLYGAAGLWNLPVTQQPYKPSKADQNKTNKLSKYNYNFWEFPDNGADTWAFSAAQILTRFKANYPSFTGDQVIEPSATPKTQTNKTQEKFVRKTVIFTTLSHPHWFNTDKPKVYEIFDKMARNSYRYDNGPIVYTTMSDALSIWLISNKSL